MCLGCSKNICLIEEQDKYILNYAHLFEGLNFSFKNMLWVHEKTATNNRTACSVKTQIRLNINLVGSKFEVCSKWVSKYTCFLSG